MNKTVDELSCARDGISGNIRIGCGETAGMRAVASAIHEIRQEYPFVYCHLFSMDDSGVKEQLDKGVLDFGVLVQPEAPKGYQYIEIEHEDTWGVLMRKDSPLAVLNVGDKPYASIGKTSKLKLRKFLSLALGENQLSNIGGTIELFVFHVTER